MSEKQAHTTWLAKAARESLADAGLSYGTEQGGAYLSGFEACASVMHTSPVMHAMAEALRKISSGIFCGYERDIADEAIAEFVAMRGK